MPCPLRHTITGRNAGREIDTSSPQKSPGEILWGFFIAPTEIDCLAELVDKLTSLLAVQSQQNSDLVAQLPSPVLRSPTRLTVFLTRLIGIPAFGA